MQHLIKGGGVGAKIASASLIRLMVLMADIRRMYGKLCDVPNMYWNAIKVFTCPLECLSYVFWVICDLSAICALRAGWKSLKNTLLAGIRGNFLLWLKDYLSHRKQFVSIDGERSEMALVPYGVPQGSCWDQFYSQCLSTTFLMQFNQRRHTSTQMIPHYTASKSQ